MGTMEPLMQQHPDVFLPVQEEADQNVLMTFWFLSSLVAYLKPVTERNKCMQSHSSLKPAIQKNRSTVKA